uniref:Uncharacterized protein n=1 Tax=uncultured Nitrospirae bacterium MY4-5C TaxID=798580 RepID=D9MP85_9BACT|nr:hypothetical protein LW5_0160 [uncultured Nitrospirae bacterium MY4-5C]
METRGTAIAPGIPFNKSNWNDCYYQPELTECLSPFKIKRPRVSQHEAFYPRKRQYLTSALYFSHYFLLT